MFRDEINPSQPNLRVCVLPNWYKENKRCDFPGYRQIHDDYMAWDHEHVIEVLQDVWETGDTPSSIFIKVQDILKSQTRGLLDVIDEETQQWAEANEFEADNLEELAHEEEVCVPALFKEEVEKNDLRWRNWGSLPSFKQRLSPVEGFSRS